ncbi:ribonuclease domain-containing protein [Gordonia sp. (in: high G+C Gram-positive bacteria)]|uniref:ribonuclease domain-containing protein n=1 Tax=Gordonia sp. (in: high G+C Gram-positive bacteria) TaxID=84139 RepID=UPI0016A732DA|nr:ribonuclease domain-containing protein [Gordonia sp. (in: high G+C Gram-positive bacteria)]NLG47229.1 ribonuclease N1 [Gordonia sp. (in: high G+C Gram-positive bacteria)]
MSKSQTAPELTRRRTIASVLGVIALIAVIAFTWWIDGQESTDEAPAAAAQSSVAADAPSTAVPSTQTTGPRTTGQKNAPKPGPKPASKVPARVTQTLEEIDSGRWPASAEAPGTRGGDTFRNREGRLPARTANGQRISYKEWDVNPKKPRSGRDAERIVTGSDGSAWYTLDHYQTFTQIRGPSA